MCELTGYPKRGSMRWITDAVYLTDYKLQVTFEDGTVKDVDLARHLEGRIFEPLKDIEYFKLAFYNPETETVEWPNGADMSPDFLYEIGVDVGTVRKARAV